MVEYYATPEEENKEIARRYKNLLENTYQALSEEDKKLIRSAFEVAVEAHSNQRRKTGEPYIYHPIGVAKIVADEIGLGATSIASALLHDVVEDCDYTVEDMERLFGAKIASIVSGLTKISNLKEKEDYSIQAENFKKLIITLNKDARVILIKIADRLHNMQEMDVMPQHKQVQKASETLFIYAPLAHRLGLYKIKTELEDLGLKYTEPDVYEEIKKKLEESEDQQEEYLDAFTQKVKESLDDAGIDYEVKGRFKSIYSIRRKMRDKGVTFEEVYDKYAIRIIYNPRVNETLEAWEIYTIVTGHFTPMPDRLRDWIREPRPTGYEAIHTTVMGANSKWVEVQIRSDRMNEIAERGYAAHFKYKQGSVKESGFENWLNGVKNTLENQDRSAIDFVEAFASDSFVKEIYVYTPKGELKTLPKGSSVLDFAFTIHSDLGLKCKGGKVNGRIVPLSYKLQTGEQVTISTGSKPNAKKRWLDYVYTSRAKSKIRGALKTEEKAVVDEGKEILRRKLRTLKFKYNDKIIHEITNFLNLKSSYELFYQIGNGTIENSHLKDFAAYKSGSFMRMIKKQFTKTVAPIVFNNKQNEKVFDQLVFGDDEQQLPYVLADCCKPIPGDGVFAIVTVNQGLKVHRKSCPNSIYLQSTHAHRITKAIWIDSSTKEYNITLQVKGVDAKGVVSEISDVISNIHNIYMTNINISQSKGFYSGTISISIRNKNQVDRLIKAIEKIHTIQNVRQI